MKESGAPRAYGIKTADDLVAMSLTADKKTYDLFRPKLWIEVIGWWLNDNDDKFLDDLLTYYCILKYSLLN